MPLSQDACVETIRAHSTALADVAEGNLDAPVEFCPGWAVRDLVQHVTEVHWFWASMVEGLLLQPPEQGRPEPAPDEQLVAVFRSGADRLCRSLAAADPADTCWTWAPAQQDVAFVIRHQVQEIVVHHWDAARAAGGRIQIAPEVAADSVDEFLHVSVSSPDDPADPAPPPLGSPFALVCTDLDCSWTVADLDEPAGTVLVTASTADAAADAPAIRGTAAALLLWIYGRVESEAALDADTSEVDAADPQILPRFRALCFTD